MQMCVTAPYDASCRPAGLVLLTATGQSPAGVLLLAALNALGAAGMATALRATDQALQQQFAA
jgi:hypothetical protein